MSAADIAQTQAVNGAPPRGASGSSRRAVLRWSVGAATALLGHGVIAALVLRAHPPAAAAMPTATIVVELTPIIAAPQVLERETPPVPELEHTEIPSPKVVENDSEEAPEVVEERSEPVRAGVAEPAMEPAPVAARVPMPQSDDPRQSSSSQTVPIDLPEDPSQSELPPPPPANASKASDGQPSTPADDKAHERPNREKSTPQKPRQKPSPDRAVSKPQPAVARQAPTPQAPTASTPSNSNALPNWKSQIAGILQRNKRYPPDADARHEHGVSDLAFSMNRQGRVTSAHIARSSGFSALDAETIALVYRVQPFPPPPPEVAGTQIRLVVPVSYD